ncbi:MAG TPA: hypothetical protein VM619_04925 [Luteimonas sp.]|nr:hypothetical protein [Luteimonas sp.]
MRCLRLLAFTLLLGCILPASAQVAGGTAPIERQMTPEEFKAAGLDKLDAQELAALNAWLGRTIDTETTKAAVQAKKQVEDDNRGFFNFGSTEPVVAHIVGEFRGFEKGRQYTLDNGQVWRQTDTASLAGVRATDPEVRIKPSMVGNAWYMMIKGYSTNAKVERVK